MSVYLRLGDVPPKRHTQMWRHARPLPEQMMCLEGLSGNYSILYHLQTPFRLAALGGFDSTPKKEWVPDEHQHMLFSTGDRPAGGQGAARPRR